METPAGQDAAPTPSLSAVNVAAFARAAGLVNAARGQMGDTEHPLDMTPAAVTMLAYSYNTAHQIASRALPGDLRDELGRLAPAFGPDEKPTGAEVRVAYAALDGWLRGLVPSLKLGAQVAEAAETRAEIAQMVAQVEAANNAPRSRAAPGDGAYL